MLQRIGKLQIDILRNPLFYLVLCSFVIFSFDYTGEVRTASENYSRFCASCHGDQTEDFRQRQWLYGNSTNEIFEAIKSGYPDDGMPGYAEALSDQEITELASFLLSESKKDKIVKQNEYLESSAVVRSEDLSFRIETVVDDLGIPWGIAFLPNGDMLIGEISGRLSRYRDGEALQEIKNAPKVVHRGQGGLMDIEIHPNFDQNQFIYLSYSKAEGNSGRNATTVVERSRLVDDALVDREVIFEALPYSTKRHHFGSRLEFDQEGYLFVSVGDRGSRDENPQALDNHCGKIHRIHDDGSIPDDNPFVNTPGAMKSIYSYGHRNPQGLVIDPATGTIWSNEHGPRGGDEVNIVEKGNNYGWPVISYGINYSGTKFTDITHKEGMEQPEHYWDPSIGVCGMAIVNSWRYPQWRGDLFNGSLRFEYLARIKMDGQKIVGEEKLLEDIGRLRDVKMGRDGYLYVTVEDPGRVLRIVPVE